MTKPAVLMYRRGGALHPATQLDADELEALPEGRAVSVMWVRRRSDRQQRFIEALIAIVADGMGTDRGLLRDQIKFALGMIEPVQTFHGQWRYRLKSTSREDMPDAAEYNSYVNRVVELVITELLPQMKKRELIARVEGMLRLSPEVTE